MTLIVTIVTLSRTEVGVEEEPIGWSCPVINDAYVIHRPPLCLYRPVFISTQHLLTNDTNIPDKGTPTLGQLCEENNTHNFQITSDAFRGKAIHSIGLETNEVERKVTASDAREEQIGKADGFVKEICYSFKFLFYYLQSPRTYRKERYIQSYMFASLCSSKGSREGTVEVRFMYLFSPSFQLEALLITLLLLSKI